MYEFQYSSSLLPIIFLLSTLVMTCMKYICFHVLGPKFCQKYWLIWRYGIIIAMHSLPSLSINISKIWSILPYIIRKKNIINIHDWELNLRWICATVDRWFLQQITQISVYFFFVQLYSCIYCIPNILIMRGTCAYRRYAHSPAVYHALHARAPSCNYREKKRKELVMTSTGVELQTFAFLFSLEHVAIGQSPLEYSDL